jgi:hypothetical protein
MAEHCPIDSAAACLNDIEKSEIHETSQERRAHEQGNSNTFDVQDDNADSMTV